MTAWEYIRARDAALAIADPAERRKAYRRAKNQRHWSLIKADPERLSKRLAYVAEWKRQRRAAC